MRKMQIIGHVVSSTITIEHGYVKGMQVTLCIESVEEWKRLRERMEGGLVGFSIGGTAHQARLWTPPLWQRFRLWFGDKLISWGRKLRQVN